MNVRYRFDVVTESVEVIYFNEHETFLPMSDREFQDFFLELENPNETYVWELDDI